MTLIIAADVQDHLILAGDHCAVLSRVSNEGRPGAVLDNYRKVYPWKYGAIAASGDVFLLAYFYRLLHHHETTGQPLSLLQIARDAKAARSRSGICPGQSTGNIVITLPGSDGFDLHLVSIEKEAISCEIVEPISARFSMREQTLEGAAYQDFVRRLRPSFFFSGADEFHRHHMELLKQFFLRNSQLDELITASFDVCMLHKRTGAGTFWHASEPPKQLAFIQLSNGDGDASGGAFNAAALT